MSEQQIRLDNFFDYAWSIYKKPLSNSEKKFVRLYDDFLLQQGFVPTGDEKSKIYSGLKPVDYPPPKRDGAVFATPKKIAFIHEEVPHYSGGRYYSTFMISALLELGHEVTVYTNKKPTYFEDFNEYKRPKYEIVSGNKADLTRTDIRAEVYIGSPINGAVGAAKLGEKYNKPAFALIFDPFPMTEKYLDKSFPGFGELISRIRSTKTEVISLCNTTTEAIYPWLHKGINEVHPVYPCINSKIFNKRRYKRERYALFVSRLVGHKNLPHVIHACKENDITLKIISSLNGVRAQRYVKQLEAEGLVEFHLGVSDEKKFDMLKRASVMINGSTFEGFGMYVSEAIATGTPFVGYDYPTFREQQEYSGADNMYLAKPKDKDDLANKLKKALEEKKFTKPSEAFDFEKMVERMGNI